ncbi:hypothetical protein [Leptolyngbya sp. PCC 6406]|uniref:hypothetical protein n=1 Tax=Leptolyngbya sp. PCC 6406 TaxID=1173264 RepID=UPI0002AB9E64|nr:hypothetical protein [Leptolyngbya sp. PCC 6406]
MFKSAYSVYVSSLAIELHPCKQSDLARGRLICRQSNYDSILRFASNLAAHHRVPLLNYTEATGQI